MTSGAGRLAGVDVARGLAVLGMATAHVGPVGEDWSRPAGWLQLTDGRSAGLFATLAGVSIGLLSGGEHARDLSSARAKVATRAVLIGLLGLALTSLGTPVAVILPSYAVMFVLMVPVLGVRSRTLAVAAGVVVVVGGTVHAGLGYAPWMDGRLASLVVGPFYPVTVWTGYLLAGLAVTRSGLLTAPARLAALGAGLAVFGYGTGAAAAVAGARTADGWADLTPHSSTAPEVIGNLGVALLVLAASLAIAPRTGAWLAPLAATGALALTAYTGQVVAIAALGDDVVWQPTAATWLAFCAVTLAACWAWRAVLGRGPLESLVHRASVTVAHAVTEASSGRRDRV